MNMELENLPSELQLMIMREANSVQDLKNLISASPQCFRLFSAAPELVLGPLLRNSFSRETLHHMIAVIRASSVVKPTPEDREEISTFLDQYFTSSFDFPKTMTELIPMCQLSQRLARFTDSYCRGTHGTMCLYDGIDGHEIAGETIQLSRSECV
ncbi:hypothetical protein PT974_05395 [Cladobotryum mycophilum]|uniref:F-box domain-containing protein n=1 Tax=Cladobotryum mycophilum TaxID=491253 RepID=A0ABR0SJ02_9HYPO